MAHPLALLLTDAEHVAATAGLAVQCRAGDSTAWTSTPSYSQHSPVRVLAHIKKLDDCFGQFLVRVTCKCGAVREITPEALARLVGWSLTLEALAGRMRCSQCGAKGAWSRRRARPRPRGVPKNPHQRRK